MRIVNSKHPEAIWNKWIKKMTKDISDEIDKTIVEQLIRSLPLIEGTTKSEVKPFIGKGTQGPPPKPGPKR